MRARLAVLVLAVLGLAGFAAYSYATEAVDIPVDCGEVVCVLPKGYWQAMLKAHNQQVDEIVKLRGQLKGKARVCPGEKEG